MEYKDKLVAICVFLFTCSVSFAQVRYGSDFESNIYGYLPIKDTLSEAGIIIDLKDEHFLLNRVGCNAQYFSEKVPICKFNIYQVIGDSFIKKDSFELKTLPSKLSSSLEVEVDSSIVLTGKILVSVESINCNKEQQYIEFPYKLNPKLTFVKSSNIKWRKLRLFSIPIWMDLKKL